MIEKYKYDDYVERVKKIKCQFDEKDKKYKILKRLIKLFLE